MIALILASGIDPRRSVIFHQDEASVQTRVASQDSYSPTRTGPKSYGTGLDFELSDTDRQVEADDDMEGALLCVFTTFEPDTYALTARRHG
jgi:hypothetical protein